MNDEILVTISCITYNHEKFIGQAIESFLMQKTNFKFEVIIHDDASTDKTQEIIKKYEKKYPNIIKPIYQKENQYSQGKKISLIINEKIKGKYVALCEGDDYWTDPYKLQKQVEYMEKNPDCGMCFHTVDEYDEKKKKIIGQVKPYNSDKIVLTEEIIMGDGGFLGTNSIMYRAENMREFPKFYLECSVGDYPIQILHSTKKYAYFMTESMSAWRVNIGNSWTDKNLDNIKQKELRKDLIKMLREFNKYSNNKYEKVINKRIEKWSYRIIKLNQREKFLDEKEYLEFYNNLFLGRKIELFLRKVFKYKM